MRVVHKPEIQVTCKKCSSIIAMMPHEICTVPPMGPYDMDYDDDVGRQYWDCPVCKTRNFYGPKEEYNGDY